ncbi:MAG TPA: type II toxin-antitoxin system RelB/DinJ family antitoxin [Roseiarcus sp.]|nr:type II toxin-antitoxin system RelB/DinJ family antitoxin [Roseiarcus sp.]
MTKSETIRARVEPALKHDAEAVLNKLGLTPTEAITLFYKQVALYRGLPFPVRIPNVATRRALREAQDRKNIESFESVVAWAKEMGSV